MANGTVLTQSPPQPVLSLPEFTYNLDIVSLLDFSGRILIELEQSQSGDIATMTDADRIRMLSYLVAALAWIDYAAGAPQLDLPKTAGVLKWTLEGITPAGAIENPDVENLARIMLVFIAEVASSESARGASGIVGADAIRFKAIIVKAQNYINVYMLAAKAPIDMPATSALDPVSQPAKQGINPVTGMPA